MIYRNIEVHGASFAFPAESGGDRFSRVPQSVIDGRESGEGGLRQMQYSATGIEFRFVVTGEPVRITMAKATRSEHSCGGFYVFHGDIPGGWEDLEIDRELTNDPKEYVFPLPKNIEHLRAFARAAGSTFDPAVTRVIFNGAAPAVFSVAGDCRPPLPAEVPGKTLLCYGSSITHGSNAMDRCHSYPSVLGHNLGTDVLNYGFAGSCRMEPATLRYLSDLGKAGKWQIATLELGINVLGFDEETIVRRVTDTLTTVAGENPDKPVFVISPFYYGGEFFGSTDGEKWRRLILEVAEKTALPNVQVINGLSILGDVSLLSADEIHPNLYGAEQIAERLTAVISQALPRFENGAFQN